jgi:capsular polysaccharide export protein
LDAPAGVEARGREKSSTVGCQALARGVPVMALGKAIYDIAGLTHQGELDEFWNAPEAPDPIV